MKTRRIAAIVVLIVIGVLYWWLCVPHSVYAALRGKTNLTREEYLASNIERWEVNQQQIREARERYNAEQMQKEWERLRRSK